MVWLEVWKHWLALDGGAVDVDYEKDNVVDSSDDVSQYKWEHWPSPASPQEMGLQCTKKDWQFCWRRCDYSHILLTQETGLQCTKKDWPFCWKGEMVLMVEKWRRNCNWTGGYTREGFKIPTIRIPTIIIPTRRDFNWVCRDFNWVRRDFNWVSRDFNWVGRDFNWVRRDFNWVRLLTL